MSDHYQVVALERRVAALDEPLIEEMWRIFERYYDEVDRESFLRDLREKHDVILLHDRERGQCSATCRVLRFVTPRAALAHAARACRGFPQIVWMAAPRQGMMTR